MNKSTNAAILLILLAASIYLLYYINKSSTAAFQSSEIAIQELQQKRNALSEMILSSRIRAQIILQMFNEKDYFERDELNLQLDYEGLRFIKARELLKRMNLTGDQEDTFIIAMELVKVTAPSQRRAAELIMEDKMENAADFLFGQLLPKQNELTLNLTIILGMIDEESKDLHKEIILHRNETQEKIIILSLIFILAAITLIAFIIDLMRTKLAATLSDKESALSEVSSSKKRTDVIVRISMDAIIMMDEEGLITEFNPAAEKMFGFKHDEVVGRLLSETVIPVDSRAEHKKGIEHYLKTGDGPILGERIEVNAINKNSELFPVELAVTAEQIGSKTIFCAYLRDISKRKEVERNLLDSIEIAEKATKAKSEFLANMSHEIRTPINGIMGMTEIMLETELTDEQTRLLKTSHLETESLLDVINSVLDFSKIEAGKLEIEYMDFNMHLLFENTIKSFSTHAEQKKVALLLNMDSEVPVWLNGDPARIRQILVNLIGNALKFTPKGEVSVHVDILDLQDNRLTLRFEVRDTGIGIAKEKQAGIFEGFIQANSSTTREFGGSGLGTTISKNLVELMGGEIGLESQENQGSLFWFNIPVQLARRNKIDAVGHESFKKPENALATLIVSANDYRILLVEDYPTNQQIAANHLQNVGFQVDLAENGQQAVDAWGPDKYDVILMDIQMPEMDGYEATQLIRQEEESAGSKRTPIIAMTAHAMDGNREQCLEKGMDDFISKPFKKNDLLDTVAVWLNTGKSNINTGQTSGELPVTDAETSSASESLQVMDLQQAVEEFGDDEAFLLEVTHEFLGIVKTQITTMHQAISEGNADSVMKEAHSIKGGAGNLIAQELAAVASELEKNGRSNELDKAGETLLMLEKAYDRLVAFVSNV